MQRRLTWGFAVFALVLVTYLVCVNAVWSTDHTASFTQLDYAIRSSHSVALGRAGPGAPHSVDDFEYGGHIYSALAPGTPFLALPFMGLAFALAGGYTEFGPSLVLSGAFVSLTGAIAAYLVYKLGTIYFRESTAVLLGFAFAFSTTAWPFATYFFQSDVSAMFVLLAVLFAVKAARSPGPGSRFSLLAGVSAGAAFTTDYVDAVAIPVVLLFLVASKRELRASAKSALALVLGAVPGLALIGAYDYAIFGNPLTTPEAVYRGGAGVLGSFTTPLPFGVALDLVSLERGAFMFAPFLVLGLIGLTDGLRRRGVRLEMLLFLAVFVAILVPYAAWYDPEGGLSFGPRFLVPGMGLLLLPAGYVAEESARWLRWGVYAVYAAGAAMNGMGALVSAIPPTTPFNVSPLVEYTIPSFLAGAFDTAWPGSLLAGFVVIGALGILLPLLMVARARRTEGRTGLPSARGSDRMGLLSERAKR